MSALGQKQTCAAHKPMSALPPKADIDAYEWNIRSVPIADIAALLDYFISALLKLQRHFEAYYFGSLEVDYELEFAGL